MTLKGPNVDSNLEKIYTSGLKLLEPLTLESTYETIVKEAIKLVGASYGSLTVPQDGEFKQVYSTLPVSVSRRKKGFTYKAFQQRKIIIVEADQEPGFLDIYPNYKDLGIKSIVLIPLFYRKQAIGVLAVNSIKRAHFTKEYLSMLQLFGSLATLAIRKNQLYEETKKALETRDLFISMAAHELRTPLTAVHGYVQLLKHKFHGQDSVEGRWVEQMYWESVRLTNLINELLEINRIRSGELHYILKECSLKEITERVRNSFQFSFPQRNLIIEDQLKEGQDLVIGDYDKILQVFTNLINNAVKFSPESTPIILSLKSNHREINIQVKDQGLGIDKRDLPYIFDDFQRGKGHNKEGMGLGLFLVRDIVSRLHGDVRVRSKINRGTTFEVTLPIV
jgi:signal transduction histidine kinase